MKQDYTLTGSNYKDEKKVVIDQNGVKREALVKQRESVLSKVGIKLSVCCMMNLNTCAYYQTTGSFSKDFFSQRAVNKVFLGLFQ